MPRRSPAKSLKDTCIESIVANMESVWSVAYKKAVKASPAGQADKWIYVLGPFDGLPSSLAHAIFVRLKERKMLRKHHIQLLIGPFFT